jgi:hypothetical protein
MFISLTIQGDICYVVFDILIHNSFTMLYMCIKYGWLLLWLAINMADFNKAIIHKNRVEILSIGH